MFRRVVHSLQKNVLEREPFPRSQGKRPRRVHDILQIPFPIQRHHLAAQPIIRRIQRNRQLRTHRLPSEIMDARHNARRRNRHTRLRNSHTLHQQLHRLHEVFVVQERFAHSHEHNIHALHGGLNSLIAQHAGNLSHDLSGCEIAFDPQQGRKTEPAIHRASHLARHADGRPPPRDPGCSWRFHLIACFTAIPRLSVVTFRHPDGFYRLAVGQFHQVTNRAIARHKLPRDSRQSHPPALLSQPHSILLRQRRNLLQGFDPLPVHRIK